MIDDFNSTITLERLKQPNKANPLFRPLVDDWRSTLDSVIIDLNLNASVGSCTHVSGMKTTMLSILLVLCLAFKVAFIHKLFIVEL